MSTTVFCDRCHIEIPKGRTRWQASASPHLRPHDEVERGKSFEGRRVFRPKFEDLCDSCVATIFAPLPENLPPT